MPRLIPVQFAEPFSPARLLHLAQEDDQLAETCSKSTNSHTLQIGREAKKRARYWRRSAAKGGNDAYRYRVARSLPVEN